MKIAYASENAEQLEQIGKYLRSYFDTLQIPMDICLFNDPEALLASVQETDYKLILLNLDYQNTNGVLMVYRIRRFARNVAILLLRVLPDGKVMCILVNPTMFILKDLSEQSIKPLLDTVRSSLGSHPERTLLINTTQNLERIVSISDIVYAESMKHRVFIHLATSEILEMQGPIKLFAEKLSIHPEFLFPHRSYIVNAFYVSCITPDTLYLRQPAVMVPIARGKFVKVKQTYDSFYKLFERDLNLHSVQVQPGQQK